VELKASLTNLNDSLAGLSSDLMTMVTQGPSSSSGGHLPLYGALQAVQNVLAPIEVGGVDSGAYFGTRSNSVSSLHSLDSLSLGDIPAFHIEQEDPSGLRAEERWRSMPRGGESAFSEPVRNVPLRLQVAHMQEMLSEAQLAMTKCLEVVTQDTVILNENDNRVPSISGSAQVDTKSRSLDQEEVKLSFEELWASTQSFVHSTNEAAALEDEAVALRTKELSMIKQIVDIEQEIRELQSQAASQSTDASQMRSKSGQTNAQATLNQSLSKVSIAKKGRQRSTLAGQAVAVAACSKFKRKVKTAGESSSSSAVVSVPDAKTDSQIQSALQLLACLKDVALENRSLILPEDRASWTPEHEVVACFLDASTS